MNHSHNFIRDLSIDNVFISEDCLASLLKSISQQRTLSRLVLCQMRMKGGFSKPMDVISGPIMKKGLGELALIDVPASHRDIRKLLAGDVRNPSQFPGLSVKGNAKTLRHLKLSRINLDDNLIVKMLCVLISDEDPDEAGEVKDRSRFAATPVEEVVEAPKPDGEATVDGVQADEEDIDDDSDDDDEILDEVE